MSGSNRPYPFDELSSSDLSSLNRRIQALIDARRKSLDCETDDRELLRTLYETPIPKPDMSHIRFRDNIRRALRMVRLIQEPKPAGSTPLQSSRDIELLKAWHGK